MIYNILKPIKVRVTGLPNTYVKYKVETYMAYDRDTTSVEETNEIYDSQAFADESGYADVIVSDILIDYMTRYSPNELKNDYGMHNGEDVKMFETPTSEFMKVTVYWGDSYESHTSFNCFYGDFSYNWDMRLVPDDDEFLLWFNLVYEGNGTIEMLNEENIDGHVCEQWILPLKSDVLYIDSQPVVVKEDDCKTRYYLSYRGRDGKIKTVKFLNGAYGLSADEETIEIVVRTESIIHRTLKETLSLNTGVLNKKKYNELCEIIHSPYVLVYDKERKENVWYKLSNSTLNELSNKQSLINNSFNINLERVENYRY